jgi:hypothetical protein
LAALDKILDAMPGYAAKALALKAGSVPQLVKDGGTMPVGKSPMQEVAPLPTGGSR